MPSISRKTEAQGRIELRLRLFVPPLRLVKHCSQFVKIHGLGQIKIKSHFSTESNILLGGKPSQSDGNDRSLALLCEHDQSVTTSIWKTDITHDDIKFVRV